MAADSMLMSKPITSSMTQRYALNPMSAKADLSRKLAQRPNPEIVPMSGPNVSWT